VRVVARRGSLRVVTGAPCVSGESPEAAIADALRNNRLNGLAMAYDRWHQRVRVLARRLLGDDAAAEDVVQEVFAALPRAILSFREEVSLETFLLAIAVKRSRHHQRQASRRRRALERFWWSAPIVGAAGDPERDAYLRQLAERMAAALDELPHDQRVAFVLCEVEGLTAGEAAEIAGAPEATLRTRLFHARRKLRTSLTLEHDE
jgi:RNA polymerase sigma-70 factor (ECF subfamily)